MPADDPPTVSRVMASWPAMTAGGHPAWAEETCRYAGTTSYSGQVTVETKAVDRERRDHGRCRRLGQRPVVRDHRLAISYTKKSAPGGTASSVRSRSIIVTASLGSIRRQQWDLFNRTPEGMTAYRVQAKTLADFQTKHPGFVSHWDPATFGRPWLPDYAAAPPERRADLDLPRAAMPARPWDAVGAGVLLGAMGGSGQRGPFRYSCQGSRKTPGSTSRSSRSAWRPTDLRACSRSTVRHPQLSETEVSTGDAWISPDHRLRPGDVRGAGATTAARRANCVWKDARVTHRHDDPAGGGEPSRERNDRSHTGHPKNFVNCGSVCRGMSWKKRGRRPARTAICYAGTACRCPDGARAAILGRCRG